METIAEVLAKYPDVTEFVDAKGNVWNKTEYLLIIKSSNHPYVSKNDYDYFCIPGLRPRPQKRKVTVEGFITKNGIEHENAVFSKVGFKNPYEDVIPASLTYETDVEPVPAKPQEFWLEAIKPATLDGDFLYRIHFDDPMFKLNTGPSFRVRKVTDADPEPEPVKPSGVKNSANFDMQEPIHRTRWTNERV